MLSILVANIKGGVGKTTVATHLASAFAAQGHATALADVDRQKSSLGWLQRRPATAHPIRPLDWTKEIGTTPKGLDRLVIDAPAALRAKDVETLVKEADVVVLPLLPGAFDEHATARFLKTLDELKPIRKNRKAVAIIGNRLRARSHAADRLDTFLDTVGHKVVTRLRDSLAYPDAAAAGLSLFDQNLKRIRDLRTDWEPLLAFIEQEGLA